ncbi:MAG: deoxyribose-phosphate aldolase [Oscillospiraceae bacterium]|nr:deoxyribose-phosphate aldolase [Oscillospiraceae bacterium]
MDNKEILSHIDHTLLKPTATWAEIQQLCKEALEHGCATVCIPPCYVLKTKQEFPELKVCTVIGFPLGYQTQAAKSAEAWDARQNGADELDLVVNMCDVKSGNLGEVVAEIGAIRQLAPDRVLKVIVETCNLTHEEKIALCYCVARGGADYIKTSTGFGSAGAQLEDIKLFKELMGDRLKIKASGGIRTKEQMEAFLEAGCDRIGTSSAKVLWE